MPIDQLKTALENPNISQEDIRGLVNSIDHFDLARLLHQFTPEQKVLIFQSLEDEKRQELFYETDKDSRKEIVKALGPEFMAPFLEGMPQDEAVDLLQEHEPEIQEKILQQMVPHQAQTLKSLLTYKEETAGGMMTPRFNKIGPDELAGDILMKVVRNHQADQNTNFFVVDDNDHLIGFFTLRDLLNVPPNARAINIIRPETPKVYLDDGCEKIANLMDHELLSTLPVVDQNNVIHGIVTFDDVLRAMKNLASEEIYTMAGTRNVNPFAKKTLNKFWARAPWLIPTFLGGLISAFILRSFEFTFSEYAMVIFFIPFVLGLAGNVGLQGATVIVRGLATGDIQSDNLKTIVGSELKVGVLNGLIFGTLCGLIIMVLSETILHTSPILGLTVGLGIFFAVSVAAIIGSLLPVIFVNLKIDPAISTGPVVTVLNDISGLSIYLSTTTLIFTFFKMI